MRRSERLILAAILFLGAALRFWGLSFGLPHPETRPGETDMVIAAARLLDAALALDMFKTAAVHAAPLLMVSRVLAALAGVATIGLVYTLTSRLFDRLTANTAAFFVAVAYILVRDSHFGLPEIPTTALAVAAVVALAGVSALPGAALIVFLYGTAYAVLDPAHFFDVIQFGVSRLIAGYGVVGRGWTYHLTFSLWYGLGAPLLIAGLFGMTFLWVRSWRQAVLISTFPLLYYAVVGAKPAASVRDITPIVPFLCVTAAYAIVSGWRRFATADLVPRFVVISAFVVALPSLQRSFAFDAMIGRTDTRLLAAEWMVAHVQAQEWIGQIPPVLVYPDFGMARPANVATFDVSRSAFVSASGSAVSPDWIVVPTSPLTAYTVAPNELATLAGRDYVREATIAATHGAEMSSWFDQQDMFFVPLTSFAMRDRPGPEIQIFRRRQ